MSSYPTMDKYDVIIIGAGVGGLTAGTVLAKAGLSVCMLEKGGTPGGYLQGFRRHDFRFDTAIHWLNQCAPGGLLYHVFQALGTDHPQPRTQQRIRRFKGIGYDYLLTNEPGQFMQALIRDFPHEEEGIRRFFDAAKSLSYSFDRFHQVFRSEETMGWLEKWRRRIGRIRFVLPFLPYIFYSGEKGFRKGIRKFFKDEKLQSFFSTNHDMLSCLIPVSWAYINDYQTPPPGGGQRIPEWLAHIFATHGGELHYKCDVSEVIVKDGRSTGVRYSHHGQEKRIYAPYVIAACDLETLYERMLPESAIPGKLKAKLREAELYASSVTLSIALDCPAEALGFGEEGIQFSDERRTYAELQSGDPLLSEIHILAPSARDKSLAPEGHGTLTLFMPAYMDYCQHWMTDGDGHERYQRGEAYQTLKRQVAEIILDRVCTHVCPSLKDHILFYEIATPVTHYRYTGNRNGTMMGARPGKRNYQLRIAHYQTAVKGLILGGHWAELGGGVPIAVKAGANAALLVLKNTRPEAFRAFSAYVDGELSLAALQASGVFAPYSPTWKPKPTPAVKRASGPG